MVRPDGRKAVVCSDRSAECVRTGCPYTSRMPKALLLAVALLSLPAGAADIYRWVDENGKVHISDTVPEKYRKSAKRIDSGQYEVTPQQRAAAEALAERDRERARTSAAVAEQKKAAAAQKAKAAAPQAAAKPAAPLAPPETECEKAHRQDRKSTRLNSSHRL